MDNIIAALSTIISGLPQGLLAISFGFSSRATGIGLFIAFIANLFLSLPSPVSFQAEAITLVGTMGKDVEERLSIVFLSSITLLILGSFGLLGRIINFIGEDITNGMIAGVGLILTNVGINLFKEDKLIGGVSIVSGVITFLITEDLLITLLVSFLGSSILNYFIRGKKREKTIKETIEFKKPKINLNIIRASLALTFLNIGSSIAFGTVNGNLANATINMDKVSILSGVSNLASSLVGGAPLGTVVSITSGASKPIFSSTIMMLIMGIILVLNFLPKLVKYIPSQSIAGFLFSLGLLSTFPNNALLALEGNLLVGGVTIGMTGLTDPFIGMLAGIIIRTFLKI